jgi:signal transduction histidine kinase
VNAWVSVGVTALVASSLVGLVGFGALRLTRHRSLRTAALIAPVTAVAAITVGVVATAQRMFLSSHDLVVVLIVCAVAGVVALVIGVILAGWVRRLEVQSAELSEQQARAEEAERARRELVSWVSHDLRTPLAGMRAMAEALEDGVVDDPSRYHRQMRTEVDRLSNMVDDLFELSRIQGGSLQLVVQRLSLPDIVGDVIAATEPLARARGVHLVAHADVHGPIDADERKLRRALSNLVVNAIRHTPHDGAIELAAHVDSDGAATVTITDECGGIPEADLTRLFDVGWRGNHARTPEPDGGAGLGLAIVAGIVAAHEGSVRVSNVEGGCRFELNLPVATNG